MQFIAPYQLVKSTNLPLHLHADQLADLRGSGLTDNTIAAAGLYSLRPCDLKLFFPWRKGVPPSIETALAFPYQGGKFGRIKLFPALDKMKYAQPPKTGARLYLPFRLAVGPLYVCEGEKKTLAAYQAGFNAVGIGGVWNWLNHGEPIDDLKMVQWDDRDVTIIPDSDVFERADLIRAIYALGRELRKLGANVFVAQIPQSGEAKVGLDDFLVAGGVVDALEIFSLDHSRFKGASYWHGRWKFKRALMAA